MLTVAWRDRVVPGLNGQDGVAAVTLPVYSTGKAGLTLRARAQSLVHDVDDMHHAARRCQVHEASCAFVDGR